MTKSIKKENLKVWDISISIFIWVASISNGASADKRTIL